MQRLTAKQYIYKTFSTLNSLSGNSSIGIAHRTEAYN